MELDLFFFLRYANEVENVNKDPPMFFVGRHVYQCF